MAVWAKIVTSLRDHPKAVEAGPQAMWLYVSMILYCKERDTFGHVPASFVSPTVHGRAPLKAASRLVRAGLVQETDDGWEVLQYNEKQGSEASISVKRAGNAERQRNKRARDVTRDASDAVTPLEQSRAEQSRSEQDHTLSAREEIDPAFAAEIERLWDFWPHKRRDLNPLTMYDRIVALGVTDVAGVKHMLAAAIEDAFSVDWAENVIPRLSKWLRDRQWDRRLADGAPPMVADVQLLNDDAVAEFRAAFIRRVSEDVWDIWVGHCWFAYRDDDHALIVGGTARQISWLELRYGRVISSVAQNLDYSCADLVVASQPTHQPEQAAA